MLLIKAFFPRTRNKSADSPRTVRGLFESAISLVPRLFAVTILVYLNRHICHNSGIDAVV